PRCSRSITRLKTRGCNVRALAPALEQCDQTRGVPSPAARVLDLGIELIHQRRHWKARAVLARLLQDDGEILADPVDGEAEIELALGHALPAVIHLPGLSCALRDRVDHLHHVELCRFCKVKRLGERFDQASDANLIDHLGELARACWADQVYRTRVGLDYRFCFSESFLVSPDHHRQRSGLRTRLAA